MVLWEFLEKRINLPWSTDFQAIGRVVDGELIGVVGYNMFTGSSCQIHMAGTRKGWITRRYLHAAFKYPFVDLDYKMVIGLVPSGNTEALDIDKRIGFTELIYIDGAHPDGGTHLLQMKREDCRWLKYGEKHGR